MNKQRRAALAKALPLIEQAQALLAQASAIAEGVRDDEQEVYDNMSEGAQNGDAGETMQAAIGDMDEAIDGIAALDLKDIAIAVSRVADVEEETAPPKLSGKEAEARRMARLPAWVKSRIAGAEKAAREADARLADVFKDRNEDDPTEAVLDDYLSPIRGKVLPTKQVLFPGMNIRVAVNMRGDNPVLEIQAVNIGMINILPQASNTVHLKVERF